MTIHQKNEIGKLKTSHEAELKTNDQSWRAQFDKLESEVVLQRERSLTILNDKEREIKQMRSSFQQSPENSFDTRSRSSSVKESKLNESLPELDEKIDSIQASILHYTEKLARKDIEMNSMKKQQNEAQKRIKILQEKLVKTTDSYEEKIQDYKDRIAVAINPETKKKQTGVDQAYVKNVLFNYLAMPKKSTGKGHMLQALASALDFTTEELNKVRQVQKF